MKKNILNRHINYQSLSTENFVRDRGTVQFSQFSCNVNTCVFQNMEHSVVMYKPEDVRDMCEGTQEKDMENWQRFLISD